MMSGWLSRMPPGHRDGYLSTLLACHGYLSMPSCRVYGGGVYDMHAMDILGCHPTRPFLRPGLGSGPGPGLGLAPLLGLGPGLGLGAGARVRREFVKYSIRGSNWA